MAQLIVSKLIPRPYRRVRDELKVENASLMWRNFKGNPSQFNEKGKRNFAIPLEEEEAVALWETGWNVKDNVDKVNEGRPGHDEVRYNLSINVNMEGHNPPKIFMIAPVYNHETGELEPVRTKMIADTLMILDHAVFERVDIMINPYNYNFNGKRGVTAYLSSLYATIKIDDLERKYAHIPMAGGPLALGAGEDDGIIDLEGEWIEDDDTQLALLRGN